MGKRARVLLVDDDAMVRRAVARALRGTFDVAEATGIADLARLLASDPVPIDAVVLDYEMRDGDALDALGVLASARPELIARAVVFTGSDLDDMLRAPLLAAGVHAVLQKFEQWSELLPTLTVIVAKTE